MNEIRKATVAIFGSCVSRDVFTSHYNKDYKEFFKIVLEQSQTTILSMMSDKIEYTEESLSPLKDSGVMLMKNELNKGFLGALKKLQPDILIVDFLADARFKTIAYQDSYLTVNTWRFTKTKLFHEIKFKNNIFTPTQIQLEKNLIDFYKFIKKYSPRTMIVLNQARALHYDQKIECKRLPSLICSIKNTYINLKDILFVMKFNNRLKMLERLFIKIANPVIVDAMSNDLKVDTEHRWGVGHTHFKSFFYIKFLEILYSKYYQSNISEESLNDK